MNGIWHCMAQYFDWKVNRISHFIYLLFVSFELVFSLASFFYEVLWWLLRSEGKGVMWPHTYHISRERTYPWISALSWVHFETTRKIGKKTLVDKMNVECLWLLIPFSAVCPPEQTPGRWGVFWLYDDLHDTASVHVCPRLDLLISCSLQYAAVIL